MDKEKILQDTIDIQDHTIDSVCNQLREIRLHLPFCYILIQWNYHTRHHQGA